LPSCDSDVKQVGVLKFDNVLCAVKPNRTCTPGICVVTGVVITDYSKQFSNNL